MKFRKKLQNVAEKLSMVYIESKKVRMCGRNLPYIE
jgi:hypothetical protein